MVPFTGEGSPNHSVVLHSIVQRIYTTQSGKIIQGPIMMKIIDPYYGLITNPYKIINHFLIK